MLELLFDDGFYQCDGYSSDEECSKVPSYLQNDDVLSQDLIVLDRAVTSAGEASSDRDSSDECEDDGVMKIVCLLFLQRMRIKVCIV